MAPAHDPARPALGAVAGRDPECRGHPRAGELGCLRARASRPVTPVRRGNRFLPREALDGAASVHRRRARGAVGRRAPCGLFTTPKGRYMTRPAPFRLSLLLGTAAALAAGAWPVAAQQSPAAAPPTPATATPKKPAAPATEAAASDKSAASYSLGVSMGEQLRNNGVTPDAVNSQRLAQGVHDALSGKVTMSEADQKNIQQLVRNAQQGAAEANHQ